jgi:hypothetical protein
LLVTIPWAEYERDYARVQHSIFSGREAEEGAFVDAGWPRVPLVGGLYLDDHVFLALAGAAAAQGDDGFVVAYRQSVFSHQPPIRAPWTLEAREAVRLGVFAHVDTDVFGASARWGLLASVEGFGVLGGSAAFMAGFLSRVDGGAERLRRDFERAAREGTIGFGDPGRRYAEELMRECRSS